MTFKSSFGKYKKKEVDEYLINTQRETEEKLAALQQKIKELEEANATLTAQVEKYKEKEGIIAQVMLDATKRAKDIEEDYRKRADESDAACRQLHDEWVSGMQSAALNLKKMRDDAQKMLAGIDEQFGTLCSWADTRLESLQGAALPVSTDEKSLESEILQGASADLGSVLKEMGISGENNEEE